MKVAVWGAGNIGTGLVRRLATCPFVSELVWVNRSIDKIEKAAVDIEHGLAFAPGCWRIMRTPQERAARRIADADLLVLTLGGRVPRGGCRAQLYAENAGVLRESVVPVLRDGTGCGPFRGTLLVVTNPVDPMTRLLHEEAGLDWRRTIGLGTVVETARLRASLGSYLSPQRPARDVWAYAVGTHDDHFVPVLMPHPAIGAVLPDADREHALRLASQEVRKGAERVKSGDGSSLHPIVEGVVAVAEATAMDSRAVFTVSCLDPDTAERDRLFYSMPCAIGKTGIVARYPIDDPGIRKQLRASLDLLRMLISEHSNP